MIDSAQSTKLKTPLDKLQLINRDDAKHSALLDNKAPLADYKIPPLQQTFAGLLHEINKLHDEQVPLATQIQFIREYLNQPEEKICQLLATDNHSTDALALSIRYILGAASYTAITALIPAFSSKQQRHANKIPRIIFSLISARLCLESEYKLTPINKKLLDNLRASNLLDNLRGIDLRYCRFSKIKYLKDHQLFCGNLTLAKLARRNLSGVNFTHSNLTGADLSDCKLSDTVWENSILTAANLQRVKMNSAIFSKLSPELQQPRRLLTLNHLLPAQLSIGFTLKFICLDILTGQGTFPNYSAWHFLGFKAHSFPYPIYVLVILFPVTILNNLVKILSQIPFYLAETTLMTIGNILENTTLKNNQIQANTLTSIIAQLFKGISYLFRCLRLVIIEPLVSPDISYGRARQLPGNWQYLKYLSLIYSLTGSMILLMYPPLLAQGLHFFSSGITYSVTNTMSFFNTYKTLVTATTTAVPATSAVLEPLLYDSAPGLRMI